MRNLVVIVFILFLFGSCKKDDDTVTKQTINGEVYNLCTDSALANVQVFLNISNNNTLIQSLSTTSGTNGTFSFPNVDIHSNSSYSYNLYIPSTSGYAGLDIGFNGDNIEIDKSNLGKKYILHVAPCFKDLYFQINPSVVITYPDSINIFFEQNIIHKNQPSSPYCFNVETSGIQGGYPYYSKFCLGNYWMGNWNITINKWKSGVHTTLQDSVYVGWGATNTYIVNW